MSIAQVEAFPFCGDLEAIEDTLNGADDIS
jgi:hypothetical protein